MCYNDFLHKRIILFYHDFSSRNGIISKDSEINHTNGPGIRLEHGLVVVGFVIGFGFVFAVGLLYSKVQRVRRFKLLDNTNGKNIIYSNNSYNMLRA